jgi:hypothetical protein
MGCPNTWHFNGIVEAGCLLQDKMQYHPLIRLIKDRRFTVSAVVQGHLIVEGLVAIVEKLLEHQSTIPYVILKEMPEERIILRLLNIGCHLHTPLRLRNPEAVPMTALRSKNVTITGKIQLPSLPAATATTTDIIFPHEEFFEMLCACNMKQPSTIQVTICTQKQWDFLMGMPSFHRFAAIHPETDMKISLQRSYMGYFCRWTMATFPRSFQQQQVDFFDVFRVSWNHEKGEVVVKNLRSKLSLYAREDVEVVYSIDFGGTNFHSLTFDCMTMSSGRCEFELHGTDMLDHLEVRGDCLRVTFENPPPLLKQIVHKRPPSYFQSPYPELIPVVFGV